MKRIKETEMLVNLAKALGQEVDESTLKQAQKIITLKREVLESVRSNIITDLAKASKTSTIQEFTPPSTTSPVEIPTIPTSDYPLPPCLDDIAHLISDEEVMQEVVEEIETAKEESLADLAAKFIGESKESFQQPEVEEVPQDLTKIIQKLKYLEQWLSKVSTAGAGSGSYWLYDLGDTDYSSIKSGRNNGILTYRSSDKKWTSQNSVITDNVYANYYEVNVDANHAVTLGQMAWNPQALTFDMGLTNGMILQVGQETLMRVKASGAIAKGDAVMFAGASGENILVAKNDPTVPNYIPEWFVGIAPYAISNNGFGYITIYGLVEGLNITNDIGTILYTNPAIPGGLTSTQPLPPNYVIVVAAVTKKSSGDGHIMVRPTWRPKLSSLSDVEHYNPTTGDVLYYNGNTWTHTNSIVSLTISANATINELLVLGNLTVNGDVTTFNTSTLSVEDKNIVLANGAVGAAASDGAGISVSGAYANLTYYSAPNRFNLNRYLDVLGNTVLTNANTTTHLSEGSNLYYTNARVYSNVILLDYSPNVYVNNRLLTKANVSDLTTANVTELTNLYYTNARVSANVATLGYATNAYVNTRLLTKANVSDLTTDNVTELTNLYYTNARAVGALTAGAGISIASNGRVTSTATGVGDVISVNGANGLVNLFVSSATTPAYPTLGTIWFKSGEGNLFLYINDGNSNIWIEIDTGAADASVSSVNGQVGNVILTTSNISEGSNLYFTNTRAISALTGGSGIIIAANGRITSTVEYKYNKYTANGVSKIYGLQSFGHTNTSILVFANGICQMPEDDYYVSSNAVIFASAPALNVVIQIREMPLS